MSHTVLCVIGTRPEAIKMAPIVRALRCDPFFACRVLVTGQHREILGQTMESLGISADIELDCMRHGQTLAQLTSRLLSSIENVLVNEAPIVVLAQGDTTTVLCAALASYYQKISFGHIEAGLRTYDLASPFPEEGNRQLVSRLAKWHFAPTQSAVGNLLAEGISRGSIYLTGNTGIDALIQSAALDVPEQLVSASEKRIILVTLHRRENLGVVLSEVCESLLEIAQQYADIQIVFPVHPNSEVRDQVYRSLSEVENITLSDPLEYTVFTSIMKRAYLVVTDSGGIQEEAPALGVPVLVVRDKTERPEAVQLGAVRMVGTNRLSILRHAHQLLTDTKLHQSLCSPISPYGDGKSAERILKTLKMAISGAPF